MKKRTWFLAAILSLSALPLMTGCGNSVASESDIEEDLMEIIEDDYAFKGFNPELEDFEIDKRKTDEDDKTDVVYVVADVKDDVKEINAGYMLTYMEYNDGWELEYHEPYGYSDGLWEVEIKDILSEEEIMENFKNNPDAPENTAGYSLEKITDKKEAIANKSFTAELVKSKKFEYYECILKETLTYKWVPGAYSEEWTCTDTESDTIFVYDVEKIAGTWQSDDGNVEFVLSENDGKLKVESIKVESLKGIIEDGTTINSFIDVEEFNTNINSAISDKRWLDQTALTDCTTIISSIEDNNPCIGMGVPEDGSGELEICLYSMYSDFERIELKKVN